MTPAYRIRVSRLRILMIPQGTGQRPAAPRIEGRADEAGAGARGAAQAADSGDGVGGYTVSSGGACGPAAPRKGSDAQSRLRAASRPEEGDLAAHVDDATAANGVRRLESDSPVQPPVLRMRMRIADHAGSVRTSKSGDRWRRRPAVIQLADGTPEPAAYLEWEGCEP